MRGLENRIADFRSRSVAVVAISVDPPDPSRKLIASARLTFPLLSDPSATAIRAYGLLHPGAGENGHDIARPAEYLVDRAGVIRWVNLTEDLRVRARAEQVLRVIDALPGSR